MTRTQVWKAAIAAGDKSMRAAGRHAWDNADWDAMVSEFNRLEPPLYLMGCADLMRLAVKQRVREGRCKRQVLEPCAGCGRQLSARERRKPCPYCGARNHR